MATFLELDALAMDEEFRKKVKIAMVNAAQNVSAENVDEAYIIYHEKRSTHAQNILQGPQNYVEPYAYGCAARQTLTVDSPDDAIQFTVNSIFDAQAGVMANERPPAPEADDLKELPNMSEIIKGSQKSTKKEDKETKQSKTPES